MSGGQQPAPPTAVEVAARELLEGLDQVGWPRSVNECVVRLRVELDDAASARRAREPQP